MIAVAKSVEYPKGLSEETARDLIAAREALGQKFTGDVLISQKLNTRFGPAVADYLQNYTGNFNFLVDMKHRTSLWPNQLAGVMNCMYVEAKKLAAVNADDELPAYLAANAEVAAVIADGYYTVPLDGTHVTLRIKTLKHYEDSKYPKGTQVAAYLFGPTNTSDYQRFAIIKGNQCFAFRDYKSESHMRQRQALKTLLQFPNLRDEFGRVYAVQSGNCYKCGKLLTDPTSITLGIGPICRGGA